MEIPYEKIERLFNVLQGHNDELKVILMNAILQMQKEGISGKNKVSKNILEKQEEYEKNAPEGYSLRFFEPYYDNIPKVPNSIKQATVETYKMPEYLSTEVKLPKPTMEDYMSMSVEEKKILVDSLYKEFAIVAARKANAQNRRKDEYGREIDVCYDRKNKYIAEFLTYAQMYNARVSENDQICFGIEQDIEKRGILVLYSSLPGYTRVSLHLGKDDIADMTLRSVNENCIKMKLPTFPLKRSELCTQYKYPLRSYGTNTGLVNSGCMDTKTLEEQIVDMSRLQNGKINLDGMESFSMFMYPNFNSREILYIAEKAGLGKSLLVKFDEIEQKKGKIIEQIRRPQEIRQMYLKYKLEKVETVEDKKDILTSFWRDYQNIQDEKGEKKELCQCFTTYYKMISEMGIDSDVVRNFTDYAIEEIANGDTYDIYELLFDSNDEFIMENFENIIRYSNPENRDTVIEMIRNEIEYRDDLELDIDDIVRKIDQENITKKQNNEDKANNMYQKIKGIAQVTDRTDRNKAENVEQTVMQKNTQVDRK